MSRGVYEKIFLEHPIFYSKPKKITINGRIAYYCKLTPRFLKISGRGDNIFLYAENTIHFQAKSVMKQGNRNPFFFIRPPTYNLRWKNVSNRLYKSKFDDIP